MSYTPQFAFQTPEGFKDVDFDHFFDALPGPNQVLGLQVSSAINPVLNLGLRLDPDAPFLWRAIAFQPSPDTVAGCPPSFYSVGNFGVRLRDTQGNYLMPDGQFVPVWQLGIPPNGLQPGGASILGCGAFPVIEPEIYCPAQSVIYLDLFSYDTVPWTTPGPVGIWLRGVKRFPADQSSVCSAAEGGASCG